MISSQNPSDDYLVQRERSGLIFGERAPYRPVIEGL